MYKLNLLIKNSHTKKHFIMKKLFALVAVFMFSIAGIAQDKVTVTPPKAEAKECTAHHKKACCSKDKAMAGHEKGMTCSKGTKDCCKGDHAKGCCAKDKAACSKDKKACCKSATHDAKCSKEKKAACCAAKKK